jgi:hypothetical protein
MQKTRTESRDTHKSDSISNSKNLNISILIDLSDRIDPEKYPNPSMQYYQRDLEYIKAIKTGFINHIKGKKVMQLNDQMQIFFNPEPSDFKINDFAKQLKVSFDKSTSKENIKLVDENIHRFRKKSINRLLMTNNMSVRTFGDFSKIRSMTIVSKINTETFCSF